MMLDAHPQLAIPAETHFVPELIELGEAGATGEELVAAIVGARTWADFGLEPDDLRERVAELDAGDAAGVARAFYGLCAEARGKPRWGDKTPGYVKRMRPIGGALAEARFVHLIRDGRDVALSRLARGMGEGKPIAEIAELWRRRIERARRQAKRLRGRYLELRYEDLVADPEPALRRVCELIELDYDPAMLAYHERRRRAARRARRPGAGAAAGVGAARPSARPRTRSPREPPTDGRIGAWRDGDERRRPRAPSRPSPAPCSPSSATTCHPDRPHMAFDYSIRMPAQTAACAAAPSRRARPRSWSASGARGRPCCG